LIKFAEYKFLDSPFSDGFHCRHRSEESKQSIVRSHNITTERLGAVSQAQ